MAPGILDAIVDLPSLVFDYGASSEVLDPTVLEQLVSMDIITIRGDEIRITDRGAKLSTVLAHAVNEGLQTNTCFSVCRNSALAVFKPFVTGVVVTN